MPTGKKITHIEFLNELRQRNKNADAIEILTQYDGMTKRVHCKCHICEFEWTPIASSLMQGTGCPQCAKARIAQKSREQLRTVKRPGKMSHSSFVSKFIEKNPRADQIEICSEYTGSLNSIKCRCKVCNLEWETMASGLLQATGCPRCSHSSTSFMEQFLLHSFIKSIGNERILHRNKTIIDSEIDIYLPDYKLGIEIGAWKWHKAIVEKDIKKIERCAKNDVTLIVIYDGCNEIIDSYENIWTYEIDLGGETNHTTLKSIVYRIFKIANIQTVFTETDWDEIAINAYKLSARVTHEEYLKKFQNKNLHFDDIVLHSRYRYAKDKMLCECKKCGHKWETAASELLKGTGCPACQIKAVGESRSKKNIIIEWRKQNPNGTKMQCENETGISRMTVYKWWNFEKGDDI